MIGFAALGVIVVGAAAFFALRSGGGTKSKDDKHSKEE